MTPDEQELLMAEHELAISEAHISLRHQEGWIRLVAELARIRERSISQLIAMPADPVSVTRAQTWVQAIDKLVGFEQERIQPEYIDGLRKRIRGLRAKLEELKIAGIDKPVDHYDREFFDLMQRQDQEQNT